MGKYEGWYSVSDETFLTDEQVHDIIAADGKTSIKVSKESGHKVEWVVEENYKFKLTAMKASLLEWLNNNPGLQ